MTDTSFSQLPSQQVRKDLSYAHASWQAATDQYKQGNYLEALCSTLRYIDEAKANEFSKDPLNGVKICHGSMQMYLSVKDNQFRVLAPFVNMAGAQKMIILRKVCEINFSELNLAKIECKEDLLYFTFSCPLNACEPWKIYDTLKEICWTADKYDDDFIILQEAAWVDAPETTPFSDARKEQSWNAFKLYLREAKDSIAYLTQLNANYLVWDVLYMTLLKIDHLCAPQGIVKNMMEKNINKLFEKRDLNDLVYDGTNYINSLDNLPQSAFFTQLYEVSTFIPSKLTGSAANVQTALKPFLTEAYGFINKTDTISAYLCLQKAIFRLLYNHRFNALQWQHLETVLAGNHRMPVKDATSKLYDQLYEFYNNPRDQYIAPAVPEKKEEKQKLFAGWFS